MQNRKILLASVAVGLLATAMLWSYVQSREAALVGTMTPVRVVVATEDIARGGSVTDDMIDIIEVPKKFVQPGAISDIAEVVGKRLALGLKKGAQVLPMHVGGASQPSLSFMVPPTKRAVTVAVDDVTGVAGLLVPGDAVDVAAVFEMGGGADKTDEAIARTLLQSVTVLAVGSNVSIVPASEPEDGDGDATARRATRTQVENVTLLVDPQQAQMLILAQQVGSITLVLRADGDKAIADLQMTNASNVTGISAPTKKPARPSWYDRRNP